MEAYEIQEHLENLKEKTCTYGNRLHKVTGYTISAGLKKFSVKTDNGSIQKPFEVAYEFFNKYFLLKDEPTAEMKTEIIESVDTNLQLQEKKEMNGDQLSPAAITTNGLATDLIDIIKNNIKKVQNDPKYIPQAQLIDKSVQTILNVKRMELDYYRTTRKYPLPKEEQKDEECDATEVK